MRRPLFFCGFYCLMCLTVSANLDAASWPQFRGVNSSGVAQTDDKLPTEIGPEKNVLWKVALPPGHSSPIVVGDRIFVTAVRDKQLLTIGLNRKTGKVLWETEAPHRELEKIHRVGSYAQSSPATDGERVVSFFGSSGLFCYDIDGKLLWKRAMGPFKNDFGAGNSPIIVDDWIILCQDHDQDSFLTAIDKTTGKTVWYTDRSEFSRNYCSPVIWEANGKREIVIAASLNVIGYDFATGKELWRVPGTSRVVCMTPVIGMNDILYVAGWSGGGEPGSRISLAAFEQYAEDYDKNKNKTLEKSELPEGPVKVRFSQIDRNRDAAISKKEYEGMRVLFDKSRNVVMALKPASSEKPNESRILWEFEKFVPFCSSPLYDNGLVFMVKDGGICTVLNAKTGKKGKTARLPATGNYYASAVAGDGKIYLLNQLGQLTVISAESEWKVLHKADFGEDGYATPAIVDGQIYLRTSGHLYCFGT